MCNHFPNPQSYFAFRIFFDRLLPLAEAVQPGELLTIFDDGSGSGLRGTFPVEAVGDDRVMLSIHGDPLSLRPCDLHYPSNSAQWSERQHQVIDRLIEQHKQTFILATAAGFIGCQGFPQYPAQAEPLCSEFPSKVAWRSSATAAAEDLRSIGMTSTRYEIVVWMGSEVVLAAIPECLPIWRSSGEMLYTRRCSIPS